MTGKVVIDGENVAFSVDNLSSGRSEQVDMGGGDGVSSPRAVKMSGEPSSTAGNASRALERIFVVIDLITIPVCILPEPLCLSHPDHVLHIQVAQTTMPIVEGADIGIS